MGVSRYQDCLLPLLQKQFGDLFVNAFIIVTFHLFSKSSVVFKGLKVQLVAASSLVHNEGPKTEVGSCNDHFVGINLKQLEWHPTYNTTHTNLCANARKQTLTTAELTEAMNCQYKIILHVCYLDNKIRNKVGVRYVFGNAIIDLLCQVSRYKVDLEYKLHREPDNIASVTINSKADYVCYMLIYEGGGGENQQDPVSCCNFRN